MTEAENKRPSLLEELRNTIKGNALLTSTRITYDTVGVEAEFTQHYGSKRVTPNSRRAVINKYSSTSLITMIGEGESGILQGTFETDDNGLEITKVLENLSGLNKENIMIPNLIGRDKNNVRAVAFLYFNGRFFVALETGLEAKAHTMGILTK